MKAEDKKLLWKEFCARIPYGIRYNYDDCIGCDYVARTLDAVAQSVDEFPIWDCKLYLRPLSSMTEEEKRQLGSELSVSIKEEDCGRHTEYYGYTLVYHEGEWYVPFEAIDWLNKKHFDYRGLIEMGLAKAAPDGMYD